MYTTGPDAIHQRVGSQYEGICRVRRTLFWITPAVGALVAVVAIFGSTTSAGGIAALMLAPLLVFLIGEQIAAMATRPRQH